MCPDKLKTAQREPSAADNDTHVPSQTNHDACFIPESVRRYSGEPLYILVALWCRQQQGWISRNQISQAFRVTARRASYLLSYLRTRTPRVVSESREVVLKNRAVRYEIYVTEVLDDAGKPRSARRRPAAPRKPPRPDCRDTARANALWNQLCVKRNAEEQDAEDDNDD